MIIIIDEFFLDILEKKYYIFLSYWLLVRIYSKARKKNNDFRFFGRFKALLFICIY